MICGLVCDGCRPHADGICTRQAAWRGEVLSPPPDGLWVPTVLDDGVRRWQKAHAKAHFRVILFLGTVGFFFL